MIRKAKLSHVQRISEIFITNNRLFYFPIFKDENYSFNKLQVGSYSEELIQSNDIEYIFVYEENEIIKGYIEIKNKEIVKLFVEPTFQNQKIGKELIEFGIKNYNVNLVWTLEKNTNAIRFYNRYGFKETGNKKYEEGTIEYIIELVRE